MNSKKDNNISPKQPVVAVLGHVDHGKSSLLDYIRRTNIVDGEAGGITQHISAYEVEVTRADKTKHKITFLDTPGHAAFQSMRERGAEIADVAILMVSAEDGVKAQTLEAYKAITERGTPFIVAINKIDKPNADVERTKNNLLENGIYLEGMGGDVSYVPISAKAGTGIADLLETILLTTELNGIKYNKSIDATGVVLESFVDQKRGISATLIIKDGVLPSAGSILAGTALSPIRIVEDFKGTAIKSPVAGQAIKVTGFSEVPASGSIFISASDKKEMDKLQSIAIANTVKTVEDPRKYRNAKVVIPTLVKADTLGTLEAIKTELKKFETDDIKIKIINSAVGNISEGDILLASGDERCIIMGFNVKLESKAREQADRFKIEPKLFDIIYKLTEWFAEEFENRLPYEEVENVLGDLKVLKAFSSNKDIHVIGGKVLTGKLSVGNVVKIIRRDFELGRGKIEELQQMKIKTKEVLADNECGLQVQSKFEIIPGDIIKCVEIIKKKAI